MATAERKKPAKLQVNIFSTTWKDVVRFDAANDFQSMEVMDAAATLGRNSFDGRPRFRIVREDPAFTGQDSDVMTEWTPSEGWKAVQYG